MSYAVFEEDKGGGEVKLYTGPLLGDPAAVPVGLFQGVEGPEGDHDGQIRPDVPQQATNRPVQVKSRVSNRYISIE
jgi:hypothetical protein